MQAIAILIKNGKTIKVPCNLKTMPKPDHRDKVINPVEDFLIREIDKRSVNIGVKA